MSDQIIIGFGHRSGVGKDTSAKFLDTQLRCKVPGVAIKKTSFAAKLKDITYQLYGWAGVKRGIYYENNREARKEIIPALGMTVVDLWVVVGEKLREAYPKTWLDHTLKSDNISKVIIIADLRHPNEFDAIKERNGKVYRVDNPRIPKREGKSIDDLLQGETRWDKIIDNSSSMENLISQINPLANQLIEEYDLA